MPEPTIPTATTHDSDAPSSLDDLYWHTDLSASEIARRTGLPAGQLHRRVAPIDASVGCRWCGEPLAYTSRTARLDPRIRCASCGSTRRNPAHPEAPSPCGPSVVGGLILIRQRVPSRWERWDPGREIDDCIDALAAAGVAWDPRALVVLGAGASDGDDVVDQLAEREPGVVAVRDLRQLASTQTERLQVLFTLTQRRWRVIVARDVDSERPQEVRARNLAQLDDRYDEDDPWSPSWSNHLVSATYDAGRSGDWR